MAEMAGSMRYVSSQKKAGQIGKAFWARDGSCYVLKMEKMVEIGDWRENISTRVKVSGQGVKTRIKDKL